MNNMVPPSTRRLTEPVDLDIYPEHEGDNFTAAQKSSRQSERLRIMKENESRLKERIDTMREHRERIASDLGSRMRNTAPNTLKKLRMLHADDVVKTMYDGPAMILEMEAVANEKLATKTDETHNLAKEEYKKWQASPPPPNCTSEVLSKYINTYRLHINPFVEQPKSGSVLSNELLNIIKSHNLNTFVAPHKMEMTKSGEWSDDVKVEEYLIELIGHIHDPSLANGDTPTFGVNEKPTHTNARGTLHRQSQGQATRTSKYRERGSGRRPFTAAQLPEGEFCAWGSCTGKHRKETCFRSGRCHDVLPFKMYTEHRELYDSIEVDRKKDCERLKIKYTPLRIPTETDHKLELDAYKRRTNQVPKGRDVNFVDTTNDADNAFINCALFGNAVNMIHDDTIGQTASTEPLHESDESFARVAECSITSAASFQNSPFPGRATFLNNVLFRDDPIPDPEQRIMQTSKSETNKPSSFHASFVAHVIKKSASVTALALLLAVATVSFLAPSMTPVGALDPLVSNYTAITLTNGDDLSTNENIIHSRLDCNINRLDAHQDYVGTANDKHENDFQAALHAAGGGQVATVAMATTCTETTFNISNATVAMATTCTESIVNISNAANERKWRAMRVNIVSGEPVSANQPKDWWYALRFVKPASEPQYIYILVSFLAISAAAIIASTSTVLNKRPKFKQLAVADVGGRCTGEHRKETCFRFGRCHDVLPSKMYADSGAALPVLNYDMPIVMNVTINIGGNMEEEIGSSDENANPNLILVDLEDAHDLHGLEWHDEELAESNDNVFLEYLNHQLTNDLQYRNIAPRHGSLTRLTHDHLDRPWTHDRPSTICHLMRNEYGITPPWDLDFEICVSGHMRVRLLGPAMLRGQWCVCCADAMPGNIPWWECNTCDSKRICSSCWPDHARFCIAMASTSGGEPVREPLVTELDVPIERAVWENALLADIWRCEQRLLHPNNAAQDPIEVDDDDPGIDVEDNPIFLMLPNNMMLAQKSPKPVVNTLLPSNVETMVRSDDATQRQTNTMTYTFNAATNIINSKAGKFLLASSTAAIVTAAPTSKTAVVTIPSWLEVAAFAFVAVLVMFGMMGPMVNNGQPSIPLENVQHHYLQLAEEAVSAVNDATIDNDAAYMALVRPLAQSLGTKRPETSTFRAIYAVLSRRDYTSDKETCFRCNTAHRTYHKWKNLIEPLIAARNLNAIAATAAAATDALDEISSIANAKTAPPSAPPSPPHDLLTHDISSLEQPAPFITNIDACDQFIDLDTLSSSFSIHSDNDNSMIDNIQSAPCIFCSQHYTFLGHTCCGLSICQYCMRNHACFNTAPMECDQNEPVDNLLGNHACFNTAPMECDQSEPVRNLLDTDEVIAFYMLSANNVDAGAATDATTVVTTVAANDTAAVATATNVVAGGPAYVVAQSLSDLADAPLVIPTQALTRAEKAYAVGELSSEQIIELAENYDCAKIKLATIDAIRAVIGMHVSPLSHRNDKAACEAASPTIKRRTFQRWKAKLYGAE